MALRLGEDTAEAEAGARLVGEFMVSVIALVHALGERK
jgi:hypothetical protein